MKQDREFMRRNEGRNIRQDWFRKFFLMGVMGACLGACSIFGGSGGDKDRPTPTIGQRTSILTGENSASVDPDLANRPIIFPTEFTNLNWSQSSRTAVKTIGHLRLDGPLDRLWVRQVEGGNNRRRLASAPVIQEGRLFVIDTSAKIHAYDAQSGEELWRVDIGVDGDGSESVFGGGVSAAPGQVYATNGVGDVVALNAVTGEEIWKVRPAGPLRGAPTIANNHIYVMTQDNQIYALKALDGSVIWNRAGTLGQAGIFGVASPASGQGTILAGYSTGELSAYRYENGRELWNDALSRTSMTTSVSTLSDIDADPVIHRGRVFALGQGGRMASYELVTGQRIWELNIEGISTPLVVGEWVFALDNSARIYAVNRASGKVKWISQLSHYRDAKDKKGEIFWKGPILASNRLILAGTNGQIVAVDPMNGVSQEILDAKDSITLPPVVANNRLYIFTEGGKLIAYQ